jgi:hypothetical protein
MRTPESVRMGGNELKAAGGGLRARRPRGRNHIGKKQMPAPYIRILGPTEGMFIIELGGSMGNAVVIMVAQEIGEDVLREIQAECITPADGNALETMH